MIAQQPALADLWPAVLIPVVAEAGAAQLATLPPADWMWLVNQAQRHALAPLLYTALQPLAAKLPAAEPAVQTLRTIYRQAMLSAMQRIGELCRLLDALAAVGIRPVVFKGAALAHTLYPSPACRPMGDIDLWVTEAEMPAAITVLAGLGYCFRAKTQRPHALTQMTDGEVQMLPGQRGQGLVELLCMTDRPADSLRLLTHTVWPSTTWLAARYGRKDWSMRLRHTLRAVVGEL